MSFFDLTELSSNRINFKIKDLDLSIINAVRRIILAEIPNVAFYFDPYDIDNNSIKIKTNTGVIHNEFLAHRISLVPLCFDENEIYNFDPKKYKFVLHKKNTSNSVMNVTTADFDIIDESGSKYPEKFREKILPKNPITGNYILLTKLKPNLYDTNNGEELELECTPSLNIAKTHSRWCPVSQACYFNNIDKEAVEKAFIEKVNKAKKEKPQLSSADIASMRSQFEALDIQRHFKKNKYDEPCEFTFLIESECRLNPKFLFYKALVILVEKFKMVYKALEVLPSINPDIELVQLGTVDGFYQLKIKNEDHTLFNTMQCLFYDQELRNNKDTKLVYIGYSQPHPHDKLMYLKLKFNESVNIEFTRAFIVQNLEKSIEKLKELMQEWIEFTELDSMEIEEVDEFVNS